MYDNNNLFLLKGEVMKKLFSKFLICMFVILPVFSFGADKDKKLLTIVTSEDSLTQFMAMVLSTQAKKQGADVEVLFCGKAGSLVFKGAKEVILKPKGMSANKLLKGLIAKKASILICPPYLPNNGKTPKDLIDGVKVAKPPKVAAKLLDKDTKVLSY